MVQDACAESRVQPMSARDRVLAALAGKPIDRPAAVSPTSIATVELMDRVSASFPEAHRDARLMARLAETARTEVGFDTIMPVFSVVQESAALGCRVEWGTQSNWPTCVGTLARSADEIRIPPDVLARPDTQCVLDCIRELKSRWTDEVAIVGKTMGPWTLGYHVFGTQNFLLMTIDRPDEVKRSLDVLKELTVQFGVAQIEAGADVLTLPDHATGDLVRAAYYRDYLQDLHAELCDRIPCPLILHICGATEDRMPYVRETGFDAFHFDSKNDVHRSLALMQGKCRLVGNINNPRTLFTGTVAEVQKETLAVLDAGLTMVGPECALPLACPLENLRAIPETIIEWSRRRSNET
jgi:[methyl-Co(III) methanol-specific corrinoid protein]:coenzyme M methyltransferase